MQDGRRFAERRDWPHGYPQSPMSEEEVADKFLVQARSVFPDAHAQNLLESLLEINRASDIRDVTRLLVLP